MCVCRCGGLGALAELCSQSNPRTSIHFTLASAQLLGIAVIGLVKSLLRISGQ
jgi:hypothetical protein